MSHPHTVNKSFGLSWVLVLMLGLNPFLGLAVVAQDLDPLAPGKTVKRELKGGEKHRFSAQLNANDFLKLSVIQEGIDVVIVDLPPGTGDVSLDMAQFMPNAYQVVVTTPHPSAAAIAIKAGEMAERMNQKVLGVIENMSYYEHKGEKLEIFGFGGGEMVANSLNVPLLASLEIETPEDGRLYKDGDNNYRKYLDIVKTIIEKADN